MKLIIAEKPSVAQTIAAALGVKEKKDGYIEGGGCLISWCGKNKEMDYFIECATSLFPNNHYSRFTHIYDTTKEFYQLITSSDTTERAILNWIASNRLNYYL